MQMRRNREFRRFKDTKMEKSKFYDISKITIPLRIQRGLKDTSMTDSVSPFHKFYQMLINEFIFE